MGPWRGAHCRRPDTAAGSGQSPGVRMVAPLPTAAGMGRGRGAGPPPPTVGDRAGSRPPPTDASRAVETRMMAKMSGISRANGYANFGRRGGMPEELEVVIEMANAVVVFS